MFGRKYRKSPWFRNQSQTTAAWATFPSLYKKSRVLLISYGNFGLRCMEGLNVIIVLNLVAWYLLHNKNSFSNRAKTPRKKSRSWCDGGWRKRLKTPPLNSKLRRHKRLFPRYEIVQHSWLQSFEQLFLWICWGDSLESVKCGKELFLLGQPQKCSSLQVPTKKICPYWLSGRAGRRVFGWGHN